MRDDESKFNPATPEGPEQSTNGSAPPQTVTADQGSADVASPAPADDGDAFLADLARAMQTTAGTEHARVSEDAERRRNDHLDRIRAREASEADQLREVAEDGVKGIDAWADAEIERIQRERERRILARRRDLELSIEDHRSLVGREVDAVEAAIAAYRVEVETYFGRLEAETDPVAIASQAGSRPAFPDLDGIGPDDTPVSVDGPGDENAQGSEPGADEAPVSSENAGEPVTATESTDAGPMIGVMDPEAPGDAEPAESEVAAVEITADATDAEANADPTDNRGGESEQPVETTQSNAVMPRSSAALLQAVPSLRPMASWFRRDGESPAPSDQQG